MLPCGSVTAKRTATYDLEQIKGKIRQGRFVVTAAALDGAFLLGFDRYDIEECVLGIDDGDFYKTMPAEKRPGCMQDVYRPCYLTIHLYVKLQLTQSLEQAVVIAFKKDESR